MKTKRKRRFIHDHYIVKLPGDTGFDMDRLLQLAIDEARERARLYVVPCSWYVELISGQPGDFELTFRVTRVRRAKNG